MASSLSPDLDCAVATLSERFSACRLVSLGDIAAELPARDLSPLEVERLLEVLADHGLSVIEADPASLPRR